MLTLILKGGPILNTKNIWYWQFNTEDAVTWSRVSHMKTTCLYSHVKSVVTHLELGHTPLGLIQQRGIKADLWLYAVTEPYVLAYVICSCVCLHSGTTAHVQRCTRWCVHHHLSRFMGTVQIPMFADFFSQYPPNLVRVNSAIGCGNLKGNM